MALKITNKTYGSITGQVKITYDKMMQHAKPQAGKITSPSPVMLGYRLVNNVLQMKIGAYKFDGKGNKHLYLEAIYDEALTPEELKLLSNHTTESAMSFLVAFSERGWDSMATSYSTEASATVFKDIAFPPFDVWVVNQSLRNLKKL